MTVGSLSWPSRDRYDDDPVVIDAGRAYNWHLTLW
jgi:hypothetical protein